LIDSAFKKYNFNGIDEVYAAIGLDAITSRKVITRLKEEYRKTLPVEEQNIISNEKQKSKEKPKKDGYNIETGVIVKGIENCLVRLSRCCNPVPGDDIIGYITRGRGVSVHRKDCVNIVNTLSGEDESVRLIEVSWHNANAVSYQAELIVKAHDRTHLLMEITNFIGDLGIPLKAINARTTKDNVAIMNLTVEITDTEQLDNIIKKIRRVPDVFEISRSNQ
jgi:GTP pyrophosphokinase